jgi:hypothetical protein
MFRHHFTRQQAYNMEAMEDTIDYARDDEATGSADNMERLDGAPEEPVVISDSMVQELNHPTRVALPKDFIYLLASTSRLGLRVNRNLTAIAEEVKRMYPTLTAFCADDQRYTTILVLGFSEQDQAIWANEYKRKTKGGECLSECESESVYNPPMSPFLPSHSGGRPRDC